MIRSDLADIYRNYIACLNRQDWAMLGQFVHDDVAHNARPLGLPGYRAMLERDFREIPDLHFNIELLVCDPPALTVLEGVRHREQAGGCDPKAVSEREDRGRLHLDRHGPAPAPGVGPGRRRTAFV